MNSEKIGIDRVPVVCTGIGLDMSLSATGFCSVRGSELKVETIKTKPKDAIDGIARVELICNEVLERIPQGEETWSHDGRALVSVCIEDYFVPRNSNQIGAAMSLIELGFTLRHKMKYLGIPFFVVHQAQIKKFATGKGNCGKGIVIREVWKRWNVDAADDNQADATAMAYLAQALWDVINGGDRAKYHKYQLETIDTVLRDRPSFNVKTTSFQS